MNDEQIQLFSRYFGKAPTLMIRSPGRVNLIGEHTDYNEGWVLPAALQMGTVVTAHPRSDNVLHSIAQLMGDEDQVSLNTLLPSGGSLWRSYVRGAAALLGEVGCRVTGADMLIDGDLPLGAGLSSSASLEIAILMALTEMAGFKMDSKLMAQLGRRVENEILGTKSGIMDQLTAVFGISSHALLIDCRTLDITPILIPSDIRIIVLDSAMPRILVETAFNHRLAECNAAVRKLQKAHPQITALRDVSMEMLEESASLLGEIELRRARHVVSENERVLASVEALGRGDVAEVGRLMVISHQSLRNDYQVSISELNTLVEIAMSGVPGVLGARLTGAGFGGCAVAIAEAAQAENAATQIVEQYRNITHKAGKSYVCSPGDGARVYKIGASH